MTHDDTRHGWIMVGVTFGLTALAFGGLFERTGNYQWAYGTAAISGAVNLCILSAFDARLRRPAWARNHGASPVLLRAGGHG